MGHTTYKSLADSFFNKIKDYDFASMNENTAYDIAINYIPPACNQFQGCTQDLDDRDDNIAEFNFTMTSSNQQILVNYMVIEWLTSNYILTGQTLKARLTTADFHALNQYQLLDKVIEVRNTLLEENNQIAINKSYKNSDLFDQVKNRKAVL